MTEEYWQDYKKKKDIQHANDLWNTLNNQRKVDRIRDMHPDQLYAICRADNPFMRHYRASPKLGIDELAMMICKDVGCDLSYCQNLYSKPKTAGQ